LFIGWFVCKETFSAFFSDYMQNIVENDNGMAQSSSVTVTTEALYSAILKIEA
jgi:hypothetical protein